MVGERGLEPPRLAAQPPQGCVYTNFTTHPQPLKVYCFTDTNSISCGGGHEVFQLRGKCSWWWPRLYSPRSKVLTCSRLAVFTPGLRMFNGSKIFLTCIITLCSPGSYCQFR